MDDCGYLFIFLMTYQDIFTDLFLSFQVISLFLQNKITSSKMSSDMSNTENEFKQAMAECRKLFASKLKDYSASWRLMRPSTLTDQLFIKAKNIREFEITHESRVGDSVKSDFMALINYGIIGLIQLSKGFADRVDMSGDEALALYDKFAKEAYELMLKKNHDYGEAWRDMRVSSFTDIILTKLVRIKEIEDHNGKTTVSEGVASNYMDIINYAVFGVIRETCTNHLEQEKN